MADEPAQPGRSRGRAKGRAKPPATTTVPGQEPKAAVTAPPSHPMGSGGRQTHRGVSRADATSRPGDTQVEALTTQIGTLGVQQARGEGQGPTAQFGRGTGRTPMEDVITRPENRDVKKGTNGNPIPLLTNYFKLESRPQWCIHQYHVDYSPTVESSGMRRGMLRDHKEVIGGCYLFDGMSDLKTVVKLQNQVTELFSKRRTDDENIRITIKHVVELTPNHPQVGQLYNTQMRRNLSHLKFLLIGRHFFDKDAVTEMPNLNLQIWQGVVTSIRMMEQDVMMLVDTVHKIVRKETAFDILKDIVQRNARNYEDIVAKELVGAIVMTMYNNRTYRIEEVCWSDKPHLTFETKDGSSISYVDYYKKQYDITIRDKNQPLFLCTSKEREFRGGQSKSKKIMLIPELCVMTGLDEKIRSNFKTMKELAGVTKLDPSHRVRNLQTFIKRVNDNEDVRREMGAWQLAFSGNLVQMEGRVLPGETIVQQNKQSTYDQKTADFSKEMRGKPMHVPKDLNNWVVICTRYDKAKCEDFLQTLHKVCGPMGMRLRAPQTFYIDDDRIGTYTQQFNQQYRKDLEMVIFIVPNNKKDRYDALKKLTCIDCPVPSQVIVSRTLSKKQMLMSVSTKIGIQLNCKLGGEPWALQIPFQQPVMIVGYDTYHDSSRKGRSAGGFVASMNNNFTKWYSRVNFHTAGGWQELSNHLKVNMAEALKRFQQVNGRAPTIILFFRDGVGDGQIRYVLDWEVEQMKRCFCEMLEGRDYDPNVPSQTRFAFFVVNKRIGTRFFAKAGQNLFNPPPGTVIDDVVTRYERYDFFLVSQSVHQGTVAPTMYNIVSDTSGLKPDHMQRLAFKLTHLYFNWPGTVSVPAPCQYAHKLAFLTGQSLHREPHEALSDKLFYL